MSAFINKVNPVAAAVAAVAITSSVSAADLPVENDTNLLACVKQAVKKELGSEVRVREFAFKTVDKRITFFKLQAANTIMTDKQNNSLYLTGSFVLESSEVFVGKGDVRFSIKGDENKTLFSSEAFIHNRDGYGSISVTFDKAGEFVVAENVITKTYGNLLEGEGVKSPATALVNAVRLTGRCFANNPS